MITPSFSLTATERVLPKLALDFTTAVLDSRITFTRSTSASNPATYVNSSGVITAASNNQPRFDHNPISLICKGLLIEESRQNTFTYSEQFASSWTPTRITISNDQATAPDGNATADAITADVSTSTSHYMVNTQSFTSGTTYAWSIFAKALGTAGYRLRLRLNTGAFGATITADFNLSDGTVAARSGGVSASIEAYPNNWYRCTFIATATATASDSPWIMLVTSGGSQNFIGDGVSGAYIWGAQLEAGAFATSYIPTTTTALTRNADVAVMTGTNFSDWYVDGPGAVVCSYSSVETGSNGESVWTMYKDSSNARFVYLGTSSRVFLFEESGNVTQANISRTGTAINTIQNTCASYAENNWAIALNGSAVTTDTSGILMQTPTSLYFGCNNAVSTSFLNGHVRKFDYFPMALTYDEVSSFSK